MEYVWWIIIDFPKSNHNCAGAGVESQEVMCERLIKKQEKVENMDCIYRNLTSEGERAQEYEGVAVVRDLLLFLFSS